MEAAVHNIAIRYNLNEVQKQYTGELMKREVRRFLRDHEAEVWPAIRGMLATQMGTRPPDDPEEVKRLGQGARPIAQLAKEAIFRANAEWREILDAEQKALHDFDLAEMREAFTQIDENLAAWEKGEPAADKGIFPPPSGRPGPPLPTKPPLTKHKGLVVDEVPIGILEAFVEEFIKDYQLDEGQITAARSILAEFQEKANSFKKAKKEEFAQIVAEREKAKAERDTGGIRRATAKHKKLLEPFYAIFGEMEERLQGLLTTAQKEQYAERQKGGRPTVVPVSRSSPKATSGGDDKVGETKNTVEQDKAKDKDAGSSPSKEGKKAQEKSPEKPKQPESKP